MVFFEESVQSFNEELEVSNFLQEIVTSNYTGNNLKFAEALETALENNQKLIITEEIQTELSNQTFLLEARLKQMKEICSLNEGFGIVSWWKLHALGSDKSLGLKVQKKLETIKTEKEKAQLIKDLEKVKKTAKTLSGTKDSNKNDFWSDVKTDLNAEITTTLLSKLAIVPFLIRTIHTYDGTIDDFISGIDVLIKDVKSIKIKGDK